MTIQEELESHPALLRVIGDIIEEHYPVRLGWLISNLWHERPAFRWISGYILGDYLTEQDYPVSLRRDTIS